MRRSSHALGNGRGGATTTPMCAAASSAASRCASAAPKSVIFKVVLRDSSASDFSDIMDAMMSALETSMTRGSFPCIRTVSRWLSYPKTEHTALTRENVSFISPLVSPRSMCRSAAT